MVFEFGVMRLGGKIHHHATETAAVLEWNFENVLIWVDTPIQL